MSHIIATSIRSCAERPIPRGSTRSRSVGMATTRAEISGSSSKHWPRPTTATRGAANSSSRCFATRWQQGTRREEQATAHFMPPMSGDAQSKNQWRSQQLAFAAAVAISQVRSVGKTGSMGPVLNPHTRRFRRCLRTSRSKLCSAPRWSPASAARFFPASKPPGPLAKKELYVEAFRIKAKGRRRHHQVHVPAVAGRFLRLQGHLVAVGASG